MGGATPDVYISTIRYIMQEGNLCSQTLEDCRCHPAGGTVGAIEDDLHPSQAAAGRTADMGDVAFRRLGYFFNPPRSTPTGRGRLSSGANTSLSISSSTGSGSL